MWLNYERRISMYRFTVGVTKLAGPSTVTRAALPSQCNSSCPQQSFYTLIFSLRKDTFHIFALVNRMHVPHLTVPSNPPAWHSRLEKLQPSQIQLDSFQGGQKGGLNIGITALC